MLVYQRVLTIDCLNLHFSAEFDILKVAEVEVMNRTYLAYGDPVLNQPIYIYMAMDQYLYIPFLGG